MADARIMAAPSTRNHALDATRAALMLLGIPFHAANLYRVDYDWLVSSPERSLAITWIARAIHSFRMEAFFLIAGYFGAVVIAREGAWRWLRQRAVRLGVPLVAGIVCVNTTQEVLEQWFAGADLRSAIVAGLLHFAHLGPHYVRHLWFLPDLLALSAVFAAAWRFRGVARLAALLGVAAKVARGRPAVVVAVPLLAAGAYGLALRSLATYLAQRGPSMYGIQHTHKILGFAPFFAAGALLATQRDALARLARPSPMASAAAGIGLAALLWLEATSTRGHEFASAFAKPIIAALVTQTLLAATHAWFSTPSPAVRRWVDASFTIYIVHLPILAVVGRAAVTLGVPPALGYVLAVVVTACASLQAHRLVAAHPWALFLFNGVPPRRPARCQTAPIQQPA